MSDWIGAYLEYRTSVLIEQMGRRLNLEKRRANRYARLKAAEESMGPKLTHSLLAAEGDCFSMENYVDEMQERLAHMVCGGDP